MKSSFTITLNAEQFNALAAKLKEMGFGPDALEKGTLPETHGVVLGYVVNTSGPPQAWVITFTIEKKPFIASVGMIEGQVRKLIGIA
jgi:hypothetical protein